VRRRVDIRREVSVQPQAVLGCLGRALLLVGLAVLAGILLWPLLGLALGVALGIVLLGVLALAYFRLKWAVRRFLRRRSGAESACEAEVTEADRDDGERPRKRLTVHVRRRPPR
jgi:uncharacterized protein (DUF58 family)